MERGRKVNTDKATGAECVRRSSRTEDKKEYYLLACDTEKGKQEAHLLRKEEILTKEVSDFLVKSKRRICLSDRYADEAKDKLFEKRKGQYERGEFAISPFDMLDVKEKGPYYTTINGRAVDKEKILQAVRDIIETEFTERQKRFFCCCFVKQMTLTEYWKLEAAETGGKSVQAIKSMEYKIFRKVKKGLVERELIPNE